MNWVLSAARICTGLMVFLPFGVHAVEDTATDDDLWEVDCVITPSEVIEVGSPVPGVLDEVLVDRSDRVEKGQIVARLESRVELASLELAKAQSLLETEIQLREVNVEYDHRSTKRLSTLHVRNLASEQERDRAEREARLSDWKLRQARDNFYLRQLELRRAEEVVERRKIRSPIDGVVVQRYRTGGEYVEDQPLLRLARLDHLHVEAIVPMRMFGLVNPGMQAIVKPGMDGQEPVQAQVVRVDRMGDAASGTFGVRVELPNAENEIPAGLKCRVSFLPTGLQADPGAAVDDSIKMSCCTSGEHQQHAPGIPSDAMVTQKTVSW